MSRVVVTVGPGHTLAEAARKMFEKGVGAALVMDDQSPGPRIITERDILNSLGKGQDPHRETVGSHMTERTIVAAPDWSLERAAMAMVRGEFRHLAVIDGGELVGVLSMRDIVRCWTRDFATTTVDAPGSPG